MAIFIDTKGTRHEKVELPASLLKPGVSRRQQEAYLIKSGQINTEPLPEITEPEVVVQQVADNGAIAAVAARVTALESRPTPKLPTDTALGQWAAQAARVALTHQEMAALAEQTVATCEGVGNDVQQRLDGLDAQQQALLEAVSEGVSKGEENISLAVTALQQDGASAIVEIEKESRSVAKQEARSEANRVAQAEAKKHWGCSVTISTEFPEDVDPSSWARKWYGRDWLIEGDGAFVTSSKHGVTPVRYAGGQWRRLAEFVPDTKLVSQQLSVHDESKPVTLVMGGSGSGGKSGGGSDRLTTRTIANGTPTTVADSSNWSAGGTIIEACVIHMRISTGTGSAFLSAAININPGGTFEITEYSLLGSLTGTAGFSVDLTAKLGTPIIPPSVPRPAAGIQSAMFVTATARGLTGTVAFLEGVVIWLPRAQGSTSTLDGISPLWVIT